MANDYFEIAVAYPLKNHKFRLPSIVTGDIDSVVVQGSETGIVIDVPYDETYRQVKRGDRVVATKASTQTENLVVKRVEVVSGDSSKTEVFFETNPTIDFSSGEVIIRGTKLAGGWEVTDLMAGTNIVRPVTTQPAGRGASDRYAQAFRNSEALIAGINGIAQTLDPTKLLKHTYYRYGCSYKFEREARLGNDPVLFGSLIDTALQVSDQITGADTLSWTTFGSPNKFVRSVESGSPSSLRFMLTMGTGDLIAAWLDEGFLEHARGTGGSTMVKTRVIVSGSNYSLTLYSRAGTPGVGLSTDDEFSISNDDDWGIFRVLAASGNSLNATLLSSSLTGTLPASFFEDAELHKANGGYVEITNTPLVESIRMGRVTGGRMLNLADNSLKYYNPTADGDRSERWYFQGTFTFVAETLWQDLKILLEWQERGHLLNFHPIGLDELPQVMTGHMRITELTKGSWDLQYRDFEMEFVEMVI